jgi:hypothetical protein
MAPPRRRRANIKTSKADIARDLDIARARKEFFPNRPDVSDDRALRRQQQADQLAAFKGQFTKPVEGTTGLVQMTQDAPRTLAQEEMRLANILGPTPREIGSDFMRGLGSFTSDLSNRIQSGSIGILGVAKDLYNRATGALRSGVDKLSSVDLEILKNKDKYDFVSNKPKLQGIQQLEVDAKLAANVERNAGIIAANRNLFGDYSEFGGPVSMETAKVEELDPIIAPKAEPTEQEVQTIRGPAISTNVAIQAGTFPTFDRTVSLLERDLNTMQDKVVGADAFGRGGDQYKNPSPGLLRALAGPELVQQEDEKILDLLRANRFLNEGGIISSRR